MEMKGMSVEIKRND